MKTHPQFLLGRTSGLRRSETRPVLIRVDSISLIDYAQDLGHGEVRLSLLGGELCRGSLDELKKVLPEAFALIDVAASK